MTKIVARIIGGLGNQLFSYAAARRLALVNDAELVLDDVSGFAGDHTYERSYQLEHFSIPCRKATPMERLEPLAPVRRYLKRRLNRGRPFGQRRYLHQEGADFDPRLLAVMPRGAVHIEGHWQSEGYFADVADTIRSDLRIRSPGDPANLAMAKAISDARSVSVHVRFFDAAETGGNNASRGYYARAVAAMEQRAPGAHYFVFSDKPEAAREKIALPDNRVTLVSHNQGDAAAYADLWLMSLCRHHIIANSSFSWWGAWLANRPGPEIIAPGFELRTGPAWWGFAGLLPDAWTKL